jgi:heat shock protein HslJ
LGVDGFSFYDGCNHSAGGSWTVSGSSLSLKGGATTLMACLDSTGAWATDMDVNRAVGATAYWAIDSEKRLILRSADSVIVATLTRTVQLGNGCIRYASDAVGCLMPLDPVWNSDSLLGTWFLHQLDTTAWFGKGIELAIETSGKLYGTIDCNHFGGSWWSNVDTLRLKPGGVTEIGCSENGANLVGQRFVLGLSAVQGWRRTAKGMLEIFGPGGQLIARLARYPRVQPPEEPVIVPPSPIDTVPVFVVPVRPIIDPMPEPVLPACPTDSGLVLPAKDTALMAGLKLDTALVQIVSRCDSGVWLDVTLPDAGSTPIVFGYQGWTLGPCGLACTAAFSVPVLRVRSLPSSQMSAQVITVQRVFVPVSNGSAAILFE